MITVSKDNTGDYTSIQEAVDAISYIQDLIVIPEYQGKHIGSELIEHIIAYVKSITMEDSRMMLCLMCAKGREIFYEKHNFIARPTEALGPGMIQYIYSEQ